MDMNPITENGYVSENGKIEIGTSSIFSRLIQEAGRWCESYASDILVDIDGIKRVLNKPVGEWDDEKCFEKKEDGTMLVKWRLGFRQSGVDHEEWIEANLKDDCRKYHYYRSIWNLEISVEDGRKVTAKLWRTE